MSVRLLEGDAIVRMVELPDGSVDSVVCDPPAGISFMGRAWDSDRGGRRQWVAWMTEVFTEVYRVMKPGAHGLVWALPRTSHWTAWALEDAGFEVRDKIYHLTGQGFPKSLNVSKALDSEKLRCQCRTDMIQSHHEDVRDLRAGMAAEESIPAGQESDLFAGVQCREDSPIKARQASGATGRTAAIDLCNVRTTDATPSGRDAVEARGVLLGSLSGYRSEQRVSQAQPQGSRGLDGTELSLLSLENERRTESVLERRRDLQAEQGQLHRPEVHPLPGAVSADGAQGRLRHGAPISDGSDAWTLPDTNGSGPPQGSQHPEQRPVESGVVPEQRGSQTCGGCGKPRIPDGLGTALKPSAEEWVLIRKLFKGTVAQNVLAHGTGAINVDATRIDGVVQQAAGPLAGYGGSEGSYERGVGRQYTSAGRWPANLVLSHEPPDEHGNGGCREVGTRRVKSESGASKNHGSQHGGYGGSVTGSFDATRYTDADGLETVTAYVCEPQCSVRLLDEQSGYLQSGSGTLNRHADKFRNSYGDFVGGTETMVLYGDRGGASRFFYCAKASARERGSFNTHPCVKPLALMQWLVTLVTPPGGTILDPFCGSGSTLIAADRLGFSAIGIDNDPHAIEIARRRVEDDAGPLMNPLEAV